MCSSDLHAGSVKSQHQPARGFEMRVARADIGDEAFLPVGLEPGESFDNAVHSWATCPKANRNSMPEVGQPDQSEAVQRQQRGDGADFRQARRHELGVAAGGDHRQPPRLELPFQFPD